MRDIFHENKMSSGGSRVKKRRGEKNQSFEETFLFIILSFNNMTQQQVF